MLFCCPGLLIHYPGFFSWIFCHPGLLILSSCFSSLHFPQLLIDLGCWLVALQGFTEARVRIRAEAGASSAQGREGGGLLPRDHSLRPLSGPGGADTEKLILIQKYDINMRRNTIISRRNLIIPRGEIQLSLVQELVRLTARFYGIESVRVQNGVMGLSDYLVLGERGVVSTNKYTFVIIWRNKFCFKLSVRYIYLFYINFTFMTWLLH